ncbi:hypothetical protein IWW55_004671 [Coemansia sp. RSA 2706]|nr:hypothetical protein IWW55_004671 [Coemansia sp. RSA 2706]
MCSRGQQIADQTGQPASKGAAADAERGPAAEDSVAEQQQPYKRCIGLADRQR